MTDKPSTAPVVEITESAQEYLSELLIKQDVDGIGARVFVEKPGSPMAECCMSYCAPDEIVPTDIQIACKGFTAYIEVESVPYLEDAIIDYAKDRMGGQLTFKAPHSRVPKLGPNPSKEQLINHVLFAEVNPSLASHGGNVTLISLIDDEKTAVLKFGGGCQGCSAVNMTLKDGVEKTLLEQVPGLEKVIDETDHSNTDNAYYS